MKITDLRIGNIVYVEDFGLSIIDLINNLNHFLIIHPFGNEQHWRRFPISEIQGIECDEEWFEPLGFTFESYDIFDEHEDDEPDEMDIFQNYIYKRGGKTSQFEIEWAKNSFNSFCIKYEWMEDAAVIARFRYVHELQNIFYFIENKELDYDPLL